MRRLAASLILTTSLAISAPSPYDKLGIQEYLKLPDRSLSIQTAALIISREINTNVDFEIYRRKIDSLAAEIKAYVENSKVPGDHIAAINTVLFRDHSFRYDTNDYYGTNTKNHTLKGVLDSETGTCFTLPLLYLVVAEKCGYPIYPVSAAQHSYCRYVISNYFGKGKHYLDNIEATGGGGWMPDIIYLTDMKIPVKSLTNGVYLATMTKREYISYLITPIAQHAYEKEKDWRKTMKYLEMTVQGWDKNVLGWYSLGKCYQKLFYGAMLELQVIDDRSKIMKGQFASFGSGQFQNYRDFESGGSRSFSKQDRLNMAISAPPDPKPGVDKQMTYEKDQKIAEARMYQEKFNEAFDKVDQLGMAPLLGKEYWKEKLPSDEFKRPTNVSPDRPLAMNKYVIDGVERELTSPQAGYIASLYQKYREYFK